MQKKRKTRSKYIKLLFILDRDNLYLDEKTRIPNILSVVTTKEEADEYIDRRLFAESFEHYSSWCALRELDKNSDSWLAYKKVIDIPYYYEETRVDYKTISGLLRIFYGCVPIGCSFDTLIETSTLLTKLKEEEEQEDTKDIQA